ncbi:aldehyde dehydrogenase family protein [uncultured Georgenia sp.]|uniref:aldehyde dehydrogenase family protein n=1 Tax=uncultured Georgenia sp. TaxID=378209 RepID=UPI0026274CE8|nr:aldehyde dehydrogenase family protein [uncultured Georgenia sp.]HLV03216.1 aldehyde dehydrogenase family protein [Actinomycetaceae bacterium]
MRTTTDRATRTYRSLDPATGRLLRTFPTLSDDEMEDALARAHAAFARWRETSLEERVECFRRFAALAEDNAEELARQSTREMGKPLAHSMLEVSTVVDVFTYLADHGPALLADVPATVPGFSTAVTRREPVGVVLGIEPWNLPLYQAARAAAPNLMLGNTVLLKPSEITPGSTLLLDGLMREAGFPADVYRTVLLSPEQVSRLIADPRVRAVTLTGSDRAGAAVGEQAGRHIKPVVLELGGSDPFIVLDDADVPAAAATAAQGRLLLNGQACIAPKRVIVTDAVAEDFLAAYTPIFAEQTVGDPFDPATTVGPLSSAQAVERLQAQYDDAVAKGATVLVPGGQTDGPGAFFRPAVITDITPEMRVYHEEAFGPLGMVYRVADADAAVELANSSPYGLNGTVFSADLDAARGVARRLDVGGVGINGWLAAPSTLPFGGTKRSGVGRELGPVAMEAFANLKSYATA